MALLSSPIAHNNTHTPCSKQLLMCVYVSLHACVKPSAVCCVWRLYEKIKTSRHTAKTRPHVSALLPLHPSIHHRCPALHYFLSLRWLLTFNLWMQDRNVSVLNIQICKLHFFSISTKKIKINFNPVKLLCESRLDKCHAVSYDWLVTLCRERPICWLAAKAVDWVSHHR